MVSRGKDKGRVIPFRGKLRNVVDIRPLEDYGREMDEPTKCKTCGLVNGHDLEAHRDRDLNASVSRHPAGKKRPPKDNGNG